MSDKAVREDEAFNPAQNYAAYVPARARPVKSGQSPPSATTSENVLHPQVAHALNISAVEKESENRGRITSFLIPGIVRNDLDSEPSAPEPQPQIAENSPSRTPKKEDGLRNWCEALLGVKS